MICEFCNVEYHIKYGSGRFCSQKCARGFSTHNKRKEISLKISNTIKSKLKKENKQSLRFELKCKNCNSITIQKWSKRNVKKFCSRSCAVNWRFHPNNPDLETNKKQIIEIGKKSAASQKRRSKNEVYFSELCLKEFVISTNEPFFNGWDADIIIHDHRVAILWNGNWHYQEIMKSGNTLKRIQTRDKIKLKEIVDKGYETYIIKDEGKENKKFVEEQYLIFKEWMEIKLKKGVDLEEINDKM